jgi:hypothetical protein
VTIDAGEFVIVARSDIVVDSASCKLVGTDDPRRRRRASWFVTDDPRRERGAERADSGTACSEYLGVRRRCKRKFNPGAGYPAGLPRDSGRGTPWATTGQDEVSVREAPTASVLTRSKPAESHRNRRQLCWQCGGTGQLGRESLGGSSWPATK